MIGFWNHRYLAVRVSAFRWALNMSRIVNRDASLGLARAVRYWHAARIVLENQKRPMEFMEPVGHLICMSVELALKSFLKNSGVKDSLLKKNGVRHDLGKLLKVAVQNRLFVTEEHAECILVMRTSHLQHFHRYGPSKMLNDLFSIQLFNEEIAHATAASLIVNVSQDICALRAGAQGEPSYGQTFTLICERDAISTDQLRIISDRVGKEASRISSIGQSQFQ